MEGVASVSTDMNTNSTMVAFDDEVTSLDAIVAALGQAGYTVPSHEEVD